MLNQLWIPDGPAAKVVAAYCRNFPEHRGKLRIIRAMCRIFWQHGMMVRSDAGKLRIDPLDAIGSFILREGGYERESLARAVELMANGGVFVDVGANIGLFSIAVSANASARCIAVDASAVATARLLENIALNRRQNIQVFNLACSSQPMVRMATVQDGNLGSTRVVEDREVNIAAQWSGCAKLEDIVRACGTTERITLLKADVEGY
jgi:FkbM family methyltransferase